MDAIERACPPAHRAALRRWRTAASSGEPWDALQAAADSGALEAVPAALAAWDRAAPGREPRLSRATAAQLERSAAQLDRVTDQPGTGAGWIVNRIRAGLGDLASPIWSDDAEDGRRVQRVETVRSIDGRREQIEEEVNLGIESLAYYVTQLRQVARQARRHRLRRPAPRPWKPRGRA